MSDDAYTYPGARTLRNKFGIRDQHKLDYVEREVSAQQASADVPTGNFDLEHLKSIHHHLFHPTYEWAGEVRTVEISKGGHTFQFRQYIETGMADIHRRLESSNYLRGLNAEEFSEKAGQIIGDVNYVHPFREGNGRTQLQYLKQLAEQAGHPIDLKKLDVEKWNAASRMSHGGNYKPMQEMISEALVEKQKGKLSGTRQDMIEKANARMPSENSHEEQEKAHTRGKGR